MRVRAPIKDGADGEREDALKDHPFRENPAGAVQFGQQVESRKAVSLAFVQVL